MIITVTPNPAIDKIYWVNRLKIGKVTQEEFLTRATRSATFAGGKGVNVSVFLSRMGVENVAMGFVGGHSGHVVVRDLRDEGVTTNFIWVSGETRTNVTVLEEGREHIPILINESGAPVTQAEIARFLRRYKRMLGQATWVVLAGSLPPGVGDDFYRELADLAKGAGAKVIISAGGKALSRAMLARPYLVKPDTREHLSMEGADLTTQEGIIALGKNVVSSGVEILIVSHEVTGDIVITRDAAWEITARVKTTQFKNLVGADDALLGGILYKLNQGAGMEDALRFGMAAGILSAESSQKVCKDVTKIEKEMELVSVKKI
jgi:1-phosphofructokinase family hexose kinase